MQGVGEHCIFRLVEKTPAQTLYRRKFVFIRHGGLRPRRYAGSRMHGVINNVGCGRRLLTTATVQLTPKKLVVWKTVDHTHGSLQHYVYVTRSIA